MSIKKSLILLCTINFTASAFAASNCTYSSAESRNHIRTINLVNSTSIGVLSFSKQSPAFETSNPTMAWQSDLSDASDIAAGSSSSINLGICCNDQSVSQPVQLVYKYTQGREATLCSMNLTVKCTPSVELVQDSQVCANSIVDVNVGAQYVDTVNTQYTFTTIGANKKTK